MKPRSNSGAITAWTELARQLPVDALARLEAQDFDAPVRATDNPLAVELRPALMPCLIESYGCCCPSAALRMCSRP